MKYRIIIPLLALLLGAAPTPPASALPQLQTQTILESIASRNPALASYQARVHVHIRMLTFPWLQPQLDGTAYYKRPSRFAVVFDSVPPYAHGINKLFGDIDDVATWESDSNIRYTGMKNVDGRELLALEMTKKIYSDQIKDTIAYVDPQTFEVVRMDWNYLNGGHVTMTQVFRQKDGYDLVASQHADIRIPHVHAVADATFSKYQTNVAINDAVFTVKK